MLRRIDTATVCVVPATGRPTVGEHISRIYVTFCIRQESFSFDGTQFVMLVVDIVVVIGGLKRKEIMYAWKRKQRIDPTFHTRSKSQQLPFPHSAYPRLKNKC